MPKFASQQKTKSIWWSANQSTSRYKRSRSNWKTLLAVAAPQSQNVHENGQPRFVSQSAIHFWFGFARISGSKTPERYGDGMLFRSESLGAFALATKPPRPSRQVMPGVVRHASLPNPSSRPRAAVSP